MFGAMTTDGLPVDRSVVVVGASLAGWRAVETLRAEGFEGTISLVGEERHLPYDRPPLSKQVLAGTWPPEKAVLADKSDAASSGCTRCSAVAPCGSTSMDARSSSTTAPC